MKPLEWSDFSPEVQLEAVGTLRRLGGISREEAEEFVANAMAQLMERQRMTSNPLGYLVTAAMNLLRDERKSIARHPPIVPLAHDPESEEADAVDVADDRADHVSELIEADDRRYRRVLVEFNLARLSPADRDILVAYYVDGKSPKAMDEERGDLAGAAKLRLHRARERLNRLMSGVKPSRGHGR